MSCNKLDKDTFLHSVKSNPNGLGACLVIPTDFFGPDTYDSVPAMGLLSISEIKVYDRKVSLELETAQMLKLAEDIPKLEENSSTFLKKLNIVFTHFQKLGGISLFFLTTSTPSRSSVPRDVP